MHHWLYRGMDHGRPCKPLHVGNICERIFYVVLLLELLKLDCCYFRLFKNFVYKTFMYRSALRFFS